MAAKARTIVDGSTEDHGGKIRCCAQQWGLTATVQLSQQHSEYNSSPNGYGVRVMASLKISNR